MASEFSTKAFLKENNSPITLGASESQELCRPEQISNLDSQNLQIFIEVSGVTASTGITAKLQHCHRKDGTYIDVTSLSTAISADGVVDLDSNDSTDQLQPFIKVVVTTQGGDAVTIDRLYRTRRF